MNKPVPSLQELHQTPVILSNYESVLLLKIQNKKTLSKREIDFLLQKGLLIERDNTYYFAKGVESLLKRSTNGKSKREARAIEARNRQKSDT